MSNISISSKLIYYVNNSYVLTNTVLLKCVRVNLKNLYLLASVKSSEHLHPVKASKAVPPTFESFSVLIKKIKKKTCLY